MKKIIIANFKMNKTVNQLKTYLADFLPKIEKSENQIIICVPFTNLYPVKKLLGSNIILGAQNMHDEEYGAFTGEISAEMLKDAGAKAVILGHSERRTIFGETNSFINKKIKQALKHNFLSILCIGETHVQRTNNKTKEILKNQISECLQGIYANELKNIIIAYEPVWAIGTGVNAENSQIEEAVSIIRNEISENFSREAGSQIKIVYGGSIKPANCKSLTKIKGLDGFLVGGACLDPQSFSEIANV